MVFLIFQKYFYDLKMNNYYKNHHSDYLYFDLKILKFLVQRILNVFHLLKIIIILHEFCSIYINKFNELNNYNPKTTQTERGSNIAIQTNTITTHCKCHYKTKNLTINNTTQTRHQNCPIYKPHNYHKHNKRTIYSPDQNQHTS